MRVAIIPARGGSKRIPRKNIKFFNGKPIIAWSINAAIQSNCFDFVVVSTDDEEIAELSQSYGAKVPFFRPINLADDFSTTTQVMAHAVEWLNQSIGKIEYACCIYPTAPLLLPRDIIEGLDQVRLKNCDFSLSVTEYSYPIQRAVKINNGLLKMANSRYMNARSQDVEKYYHDAAQFYWGKSDAWIRFDNIFSGKCIPVVLPNERVQDIDSLSDWRIAEIKHQLMCRESGV